MFKERIKQDILNELYSKVDKIELEIINFDLSNLCEYFENRYINERQKIPYSEFINSKENKEIIQLYVKLCVLSYTSEIIKLNIYNKLKEISNNDPSPLPDDLLFARESLLAQNLNIIRANAHASEIISRKNQNQNSVKEILTSFEFEYLGVLLFDYLNKHIQYGNILEVLSSSKEIIEILNSLIDGLIIELYLKSGIMARPFAKFEHLDRYINEYFAMPCEKKNLFEKLEKWCPKSLLAHEHFVLTNCNKNIADSIVRYYSKYGNKCAITNFLNKEVKETGNRLYEQNSGYDNEFMSMEYDNPARRLFPFLFKYDIISPTKAYKECKPVTNDWYINGVGSINNTIDTLSVLDNQINSRKIAKKILENEHTIKVHYKNGIVNEIHPYNTKIRDNSYRKYHYYDVISLAIPNYSVLDNLVNLLENKQKIEKRNTERFINKIFNCNNLKLKKYITPSLFESNHITEKVHILDIISFDRYSCINLHKAIPEFLMIDDFIYDTINLLALICKSNSIVNNNFDALYVNAIKALDEGLSLDSLNKNLKDKNLKNLLSRFKNYFSKAKSSDYIAQAIQIQGIIHMHLITQYKLNRFISSIEDIVKRFKIQFENWILSDGCIINHLVEVITNKIINRFGTKSHILKEIASIEEKYPMENKNELFNFELINDIQNSKYKEYLNHKLNANVLNYTIFNGFYNNISSKMNNQSKTALQKYILYEFNMYKDVVDSDNFNKYLPKVLTKFNLISNNYNINEKITNSEHIPVLIGGISNNNNEMTYCLLEDENEENKNIDISDSIPNFHNLLRTKIVVGSKPKHTAKTEPKLCSVLNYTGYKELQYFMNVPTVYSEFGRLYLIPKNKLRDNFSHEAVFINHNQNEQFFSNKITIDLSNRKLISNGYYSNFDVVNTTSTTWLLNHQKKKQYNEMMQILEDIIHYVINNIDKVYNKEKLEKALGGQLSEEQYEEEFKLDIKTELLNTLVKINVLKLINESNCYDINTNNNLHDCSCAHLEMLINSNNLNEISSFIINISTFNLNLFNLSFSTIRSNMSGVKIPIIDSRFGAIMELANKTLYHLCQDIVFEELSNRLKINVSELNKNNVRVEYCKQTLFLYLCSELIQCSKEANCFYTNYKLEQMPANLWYQYYVYAIIKILLKSKIFDEKTILNCVERHFPKYIAENLFINPKKQENSKNTNKQTKESADMFYCCEYSELPSMSGMDNSLDCYMFNELFNKNNIMGIRNNGILTYSKNINAFNKYKKNLDKIIEVNINSKSTPPSNKLVGALTPVETMYIEIPKSIEQQVLPEYSEILTIMPLSLCGYDKKTKPLKKLAPIKFYKIFDLPLFRSYVFNITNTTSPMYNNLLVDVGLPIASFADATCNVQFVKNDFESLALNYYKSRSSFEHNPYNYNNGWEDLDIKALNFYETINRLLDDSRNIRNIISNIKIERPNIINDIINRRITNEEVECEIYDVINENEEDGVLLRKIMKHLKDSTERWPSHYKKSYTINVTNEQEAVKISPKNGSCLHSSYCFINSNLMTEEAKREIEKFIKAICKNNIKLKSNIPNTIYKKNQNDESEIEQRIELILTPPFYKNNNISIISKYIDELKSIITHGSEDEINNTLNEISEILESANHEAIDNLENFYSKLVPIHVKIFEIGAKLAKNKEHINQNYSNWLIKLFELNKNYILNKARFGRSFDDTVDYHHLNSIKTFPNVNLLPPANNIADQTIYHELMLNGDKYISISCLPQVEDAEALERNLGKHASHLSVRYNPVRSYYEVVFENNKTATPKAFIEINSENTAFSMHELLLAIGNDLISPDVFIKQQERLFNSYHWIFENTEMENPFSKFKWESNILHKLLTHIYLLIPYMEHTKLDVIWECRKNRTIAMEFDERVLGFKPVSYIKSIYDALFGSNQYNLKNYMKAYAVATGYRSPDEKSKTFTTIPYLAPYYVEPLRRNVGTKSYRESSYHHNNRPGHEVFIIRQEYLNPFDLILLMNDSFNKLYSKEDLFDSSNIMNKIKDLMMISIRKRILEILNSKSYNEPLSDDSTDRTTIYYFNCEGTRSLRKYTTSKNKQKNSLCIGVIDVINKMKARLLENKKMVPVKGNKTTVLTGQIASMSCQSFMDSISLIQCVGLLKESISIKINRENTKINTETSFEGEK